MSPRRSISITAAHKRNFNHFITLRECVDIAHWNTWLKTNLGPIKGTAEWLHQDRWHMLGGRVAFKDAKDAAAFIEAAGDDLMKGLKIR